MNDLFHVVRYTGPFGFIKPWTAVRDDQTYSQQFLTPSIVEGMRQKLGVSGILRHRLRHDGFSRQQEAVQSGGFKKNTRAKTLTRSTGVLTRGVMLNPILHLAFATEEEAHLAAGQHLCLCRNEDLIYPADPVQIMSLQAFERIVGFELMFGRGRGAFLVGYNRFSGGTPMYGRLRVEGNPSAPDVVEL